MSPEQARGKRADFRPTVLLRGYPVRDGDRPSLRVRPTAETVAAVLQEEPPPIASL